MKNLRSFLIFIFSLFPLFCVAQKHDTLTVVEVISKNENLAISNSSPIQILKSTEPFKTNSTNVADAIKHFAGVLVKDYGGIGGLKTIDVRSLGATHTGLLYDGIAISSAQAGVIDFSKFSLDNISQIELHNNGPADILSTARAFSYSSLIILKTTSGAEKPMLENLLNLKLQKGSFGYFAPSFLLQKKISKTLITAVNALLQKADGDYLYKSYENSSENKNRINSDIKSFKLETDVAWFLNSKNKINFKSYFYDSKRGLPGAIIFYNTISNQRLNENEFFVQATWKNKVSTKSELLLSTKYQKDKSYYLDPSYSNSFGKLENEFHQQELYLSAAFAYKISQQLKVSFSSDLFNNRLKRTDIFAINFSDPNRVSWLNNAAFQFKKNQFEVTGNVLFTSINEQVKIGPKGRNILAFSESIALSFQPLKRIPLRSRIFYRRVFRAPTFNELYYTNFGNTALRPEVADQYNIGFTYEKKHVGLFDKVSLTADAYYNYIKDKILAVPRSNLFQWSAQNIAKTSIKGIDIAIHAQLKKWKSVIINTDIAYTFQQAQDVSDRFSTLYKSQLPYTPKNSGSGTLGLQYKHATVNYNMLFSSYRYRPGDPIFDNLLQPWSSTDLSFAYNLREKYRTNYKVIFELNNIFKEQYEIIKFYPMPLNNHRLTLQFSLKNKNQTI